MEMTSLHEFLRVCGNLFSGLKKSIFADTSKIHFLQEYAIEI